MNDGHRDDPGHGLCAHCGEATPMGAACVVCGGDPLLDGRYRLDALLGRGATGATYRATRLSDGAIFAIKESLFHRADSVKAIELIEREAAVSRQLHHPKIPRFEEAFTAGVGKQLSLCLVQELVDGTTLDEERAIHRFTETDVLDLMAEVLDTLAYLASLHPAVVHRDLKPRNLMRRAHDGAIVLIDFGAVRDAPRDLGGSTVAGTFGFMAPEQLAGHATPASDIYGLAATVVSLLAGVGAEKLLDARGGLDWRRAVQVTPGLASLLDAMLSIDPMQRPTALEAAHDVRSLLGQAPRRLPAPQSAAVTLPTTLLEGDHDGSMKKALWIAIVIFAVGALIAFSMAKAAPPPPRDTYRTTIPVGSHHEPWARDHRAMTGP
jgi:serine/threonine protein kinase